MWPILFILLVQASIYQPMPNKVYKNCIGIRAVNCDVACLEHPNCVGYTMYANKNCALFTCENATLNTQRGAMSFVKLPEVKNCTRAYPKASISGFKKVPTDSNICEITEPMPGSHTKIDSKFTCGLRECLQWCAVNSACIVAMYKPGTCMIVANAHTTDTNPRRYLEMQQWQVYQKYSMFKLPYYSQLCAEFTRNICRGQCKWGKGKPGYNRPIYGGFEGKWCGRIKCVS